jgi:hypothetical protein
MPCRTAFSANGAARAAACLTVLMYQLEGSPEPLLRDRIGRLAAGEAAAARLASLVDRGVPAGGRAAAGVLSVHVDMFSEQVAQVFLWTAVARSTKSGSPDSDAIVEAGWFTETMLLNWSGDHWTLAQLSRTVTAPPSGSPNLGRDWQEPSYVD